MESAYDEECSSSVTGPSPGRLCQERRDESVSSLKKALVSSGALPYGSKAWFLAAELEARIFTASGGEEASYVAALNKKLNEVSRGVLHREKAAALRAPVEQDLRPVTPPCEREEGSWRHRPCADGAPAGAVEAAPPPRPVDSAAGHGLSEEARNLVHHLKCSYFVALQAAYVALVAAMKQMHTLPVSEQQSLALFKRLTLGLALFLSARQERIPKRFTVEKLRKLEGEVVQILTAVAKKARTGVLRLSPEALQAIAKALAAVRARQTPGRGATGVGPGVRAGCSAEHPEVVSFECLARSKVEEAEEELSVVGPVEVCQEGGGCSQGSLGKRKGAMEDESVGEGPEEKRLRWSVGLGARRAKGASLEGVKVE